MQMRSFGGLANTPSKLGLCSTTRGHSLLISSSTFSSSSGGSGRGRGRGIGRGTSPSPTDADDDVTETDPFLPPLGLGHGRGKPIPSSTPIIPSFSPWNSTTNPSAGRGRPQPSDSLSQPQQEPFPVLPSKKPIFLRRDDDDDAGSDPKLASKYDFVRTPEEGVLPRSLSLGLPGAGRGKPVRQPEPDEVNRHLRQRSASVGPSRGRMQPSSPSSPRLSREEAVKKAVGILSRGGGGGGVEAGGRGRGGRGRGRGRGGRGIQTPRFRGGRGLPRDSEDDLTGELYLGDDADGDRLVKGIGEENMNELIEGFEEMSGRVLPSLMEEAYLDALHTNNLIEYEPEYLMEEFGTNPDIDETPPIPLRDALEKMKPFLMAYEGIQSQKEWEEIMDETMAKAPYMKQLIDIYSGPDRVTAKQQQEELERVAKTLPDNIPSSVKRFTDRAVLSLQSNPGWGFDKKCQFMDKLVWEVSQHYK